MNSKWSYVFIYLDDLISASEDQTILDILERTLKSEFEIKSLRCYLELNAERNETGDYFIIQRKYIADVV